MLRKNCKIVLNLTKIPGISPSKTAASFVRPSRRSDPEQTFVEAVHQKYATGAINQASVIASNIQIEISGKVVEEVGFDKISAQLARLHELRIVLIDGLQINGAETPDRAIREVCPRIAELDLSRNLFQTCKEIIHICRELDGLRILKLK